MKTLKEFVNWLEEEKSPFSFDVFKTKSNLVEIRQYLNQTGKRPIGTGQTRTTWGIDEQHVVKVLNAKEDIDQNIQELKNSQCLGPTYSVQVLDHHPQFLWLLEERLQVVGDQIETYLHNLGVDVSSDQIDMLIDIGVSKETKQSHPRSAYLENQHVLLYGENDWYTGLIDKLKHCNVHSEDFHSTNWGIRASTGKLVLLDLGF